MCQSFSFSIGKGNPPFKVGVLLTASGFRLRVASKMLLLILNVLLVTITLSPSDILNATLNTQTIAACSPRYDADSLVYKHRFTCRNRKALGHIPPLKYQIPLAFRILFLSLPGTRAENV